MHMIFIVCVCFLLMFTRATVKALKNSVGFKLQRPYKENCNLKSCKTVFFLQIYAFLINVFSLGRAGEEAFSNLVKRFVGRISIFLTTL